MKDSIFFNKVVPEYKFNSVTQKVEIVGEIDLQKQIESNMVEPLEVIFDKFMGIDTQAKHECQTLDRRIDKLDLALRSIHELENLRDEYDLPMEFTHQQVVDYVKTKYDEVTKKVDYIKSNLFVEKKEKTVEDEEVSIKQKGEQEKL